MDGRRRQWIAWDVLFYGGTLGRDIRVQFGATGLVVFNAFLCACKRNGVQGRMSYVSEADALGQMMLPAFNLVGEDGETWTLDQLWAFLSKRHQVRRERRSGVTSVISTTWEKWQRTPGQRSSSDETSTTSATTSNSSALTTEPRANHDDQTRRSDPKNTTTLQTIVNDDSYHDIDLDPEIERDTDLDTSFARSAVEDAIDLHQEQAQRISLGGGDGELRGWIDRLTKACTGDNRGFIQSQAVLVIALCLKAGPELALAAAIHEAETTTKKLVVPKGLFPIFDRHRVARGLQPANLVLPDIAKRAS